MSDYSLFGYNQYLQKIDSLPGQGIGSITIALEFETLYEVASQRIYASKVNLGNFVERAIGGSAVGTFNLAQALNLTSSITYNTPQTNVRTFGKPIVGIYQGAGTTSGNQIYPIRGASVTLGRYDVVGGQMDYSNYDGTADQWRAMIIDTNGTSNQVITFIADWAFLDYRTGNAS